MRYTCDILKICLVCCIMKHTLTLHHSFIEHLKCSISVVIAYCFWKWLSTYCCNIISSIKTKFLVLWDIRYFAVWKSSIIHLISYYFICKLFCSMRWTQQNSIYGHNCILVYVRPSYGLSSIQIMFIWSVNLS